MTYKLDHPCKQLPGGFFIINVNVDAHKCPLCNELLQPQEKEE